jgi:hypothetical protein
MRYLSSAAAASFLCWFGLPLVYASNPFRGDHFAMELIMFIVGTCFTVVGAFLPFLASRWLARRMQIHNVCYDGVCGGITGLVLGPLALSLLPNISLTGIPDVPFWDGYVMSLARTGPFFLTGGVAGGLVYRMLSAEQTRR